MKIVKPFFVSIIVWVVLLIIDVFITYNNMSSLSGAGDMLTSALSGQGLQKTSLMGVVFSLDGISISFRFFFILLLFVGIGVFLFNKNLFLSKSKTNEGK